MKKFILILLAVFVTINTNAQLISDLTSSNADTIIINPQISYTTGIKYIVKANQHIRIIAQTTYGSGSQYVTGGVMCNNAPIIFNYLIDSVLTPTPISGCTNYFSQSTFLKYWDYKADSTKTKHEFQDNALTFFKPFYIETYIPYVAVVDCTLTQSDTIAIAIASLQYITDSTIFTYRVRTNQHIRIIPTMQAQAPSGLYIPAQCSNGTIPTPATYNYYIDHVLNIKQVIGCTAYINPLNSIFAYWDYKADSVDTSHIFVDGVFATQNSTWINKPFFIETVTPVGTTIKNMNIVNNIKVGPNPVENKLNISYTSKEKSICQVFNITGTLIYENSINKGDNNLQIDFENFQHGLYIVKIDNQLYKIVK